MVDRVEKTVPRAIIDSERDGFHAAIEPLDAATLIVVDRSAGEAKVLLGRRHAGHVFMPGKFVFPGGRVDPSDGMMPTAKPLHPDTERRLKADNRRAGDVRALALAAIRETFEETGLVIGARGSLVSEIPAGPWTDFVKTGFYPDPSGLQLIARAITPAGFPRRFDARFFTADAQAITFRVKDVIQPEAELVELTWLPISAAKNLDLPVITGIVLDELEERLGAGFRPSLPVPYYDTRNGDFTRDLID